MYYIKLNTIGSKIYLCGNAVFTVYFRWRRNTFFAMVSCLWFTSKIQMTTGWSELRNSYIRCSYITNKSINPYEVMTCPSGLGNYVVCKSFATTTILRSLESGIQSIFPKWHHLRWKLDFVFLKKFRCCVYCNFPVTETFQTCSFSTGLQKYKRRLEKKYIVEN